MNRSLGIALLAISLFALCSLPTRVSAAPAYIVSGMVTAPGGVIASSERSEGLSLASLLDFFVAPAQAKLSGLLPVPNGTRVELVRVNDSGRTSAPVATTTTRYGRYQFDLTALRRSVSSRLLVRVDNVATGEQLRAFVSDRTVDLNPVSETAVRLVLEAVAASPDVTLDNFTVTELEDLNGSLDLLSSANDLQAGADIEASVQDVRDAVAGNAGIRAFLTASARPGQTSAGPGDIGNFFPFTKGLSWTYQVRNTDDDAPTPTYTNTVLINGTRVINGVTTTVFRNSNPDGDGVADNEFNKKTSSGLYDWKPVRDGDSNRPFRFVRFPAAPGSSFTQSLGDIGLNQDIDRDGIVERFAFTATTTVISLGTVTVPAGTLPKTLKIRTVISGGATVSSTRKRISVTMTVFEWYTQNLGLSKQSIIYSASYDGSAWKDTLTQELTEANGFPFTGEFPLNRSTSIDIESNAIACDSVRGKLFVSVPRSANDYANNVVVIDAVSGQIDATIPIGTDPGPLALSNDGQFLYVGLNDGDHGTVRQISVPSLTAGAEWAISDFGPYTPRYAHDIAVQPDDPETILVSVGQSVYKPDEPWYLGGMNNVVLLSHGDESPLAVVEGVYNPYWITWIETTEDPNIIYGYNGPDQYVFHLNDAGVSTFEKKASGTFIGLTDYKYDSGKIYIDLGRALDAITGARIATYTTKPMNVEIVAIEPDSSRNRVAVSVVRDEENGVVEYVEIYDIDSQIKLDEIKIPTGGITRLEACGDTGYAMRIVDYNAQRNLTYRLVLTKFGQASPLSVTP